MSNYFAPQGMIFIAPVATPTAFKWLCDCSALDLEFDSSVVSHQEGFTGLRSTNASFIRHGGASLSLTLDEINKNALEVGVCAMAEHTQPGTVTDETLAFDENGFALLQKTMASNVEVINASTGLALKTMQYSVLHGCVIKLHDLSLRTKVLRASYQYAAKTKNHIMASLKKQYVLKYVGTNSAENDAPLELYLNRVSFGMADKISFISNEFGKFTLKAGLMPDSFASANSPFGQYGYIMQ